jgi:maleamate amidohydrolase
MARDFEDHCWKDVFDAETFEIYEPYRRDLRVGRSPAVLAIDLYNKVYQGGRRPVREVNARHSSMPGTRLSRPASCSRRRGRPAYR